MFSNEVIGKYSEDTLQSINLKNDRFIIFVKRDIIFAYLVDHSTKSDKFERYVELIAEEFLDQFHESVKNFNGDLGQFNCFDSVINKYFCL
ncbi:unnamed protein product [marine sediment metagenome]|uniref:FUZ/MON1/HPS1 first Longin domain-containing protein n=1 Tax=marine sediment metagenome TaxID=412755 RepID=X1B9G9_9ZZZZ